MSKSPLTIKSKVFALEVIRACKELREAKCEIPLINQLLRLGTYFIWGMITGELYGFILVPIFFLENIFLVDGYRKELEKTKNT